MGSWIVSTCLAVRNNIAMDIHVQSFAWAYVVNVIGYTPKGGIAVSYGNSIFDLRKNYQTIFQSSYTIFQFHQHCIKAPTSLHPSQYFPLYSFLTITIQVGEKWYLIVIMTSLHLMAT